MSQQEKYYLALSLATGLVVALILALGDQEWAYVALFFVLLLFTVRWMFTVGRSNRTQVLIESPENEYKTKDHASRILGLTEERLRILSELPVGLEVTHTPNPVKALQNGCSGRAYTWMHATTVTAKTASTIIEFGAFVPIGEKWIFNTVTGVPFTNKHFSEWYSCPQGKLVPGHAYSDNSNWTGGDKLRGDKTWWYFIAVTEDGRQIKGESVVELLPELSAIVPKYDDDLFNEVLSENTSKSHLEALLAQGANINARDEFGRTPLYYAAGHDFDGRDDVFLEIVELLLDKGADVNPKQEITPRSNKYPWSEVTTPLHIAAFNSHKMVELLIRYGADVNARNFREQTPLHIAAFFKHELVATPIVAQMADVNAKDRDGNTPLHVAALHQSKAVVELLIASGADINAKNKLGETPLDIASRHKVKEVAELLISKLAVAG